jgi:hypothetical protein
LNDASAGYGRVGANVQQDEHAPKRLDALSQRVKAAADPKVLAVGPHVQPGHHV